MPLIFIVGLFYIVIEFLLVLSVIQHLGLFIFLLEVAISGFIGGVLLFKNPFEDLKNIRNISFAEDFVLRSFGGFLLLLPGVLCDIFGIILILIASIRPQRKNHEEGVVDVEVLDKEK
ncbi:FxsA family protein [Helicobacter suis]|uniref:FxsA family protein n=1 Tax=Helicobacter suis TaxID=104628 RepID=UPI0002DBD190|nr:FxsA family protein [Helicobacter suis]BCD48136.1 hypothetical protein NHP194003_13400 [Helicobacter suis]BCD49897.1 hypothetical protein NHP194004_13440 [Helicobacter suis]